MLAAVRQRSGDIHWAAFLTQLASAASFNVTAAPYVSDYSRYLPARTPRAQELSPPFSPVAAVSAIWLIIVGAWLATHMGATDGLLALTIPGRPVAGGLGSLLAAVSIVALFTTCGMNAYSAMLTFVTICDCLRSGAPDSPARIDVIVGVMVVWIVPPCRWGLAAMPCLCQWHAGDDAVFPDAVERGQPDRLLLSAQGPVFHP